MQSLLDSMRSCRLGRLPVATSLLVFVFVLGSAAAIARDSVRETITLHLSIVDNEGQPLAARVSIRDADHQIFPGYPDSVLLSHGGEGGYFYVDGEVDLSVPSGVTDILVCRGFDYREAQIWPDIQADTTIVITLTQYYDSRAEGWFGGDGHVHTQHDPIHLPISPDDVALIARAEDLAHVWCLDQKYEFTGGPHELSTPEATIYFATEYRNMATGHVGLLGLKDLVTDCCCWPPEPVYPLLSDMRAEWDPGWDEALVVAHPHNGGDFSDATGWPGSGLARELPVMAALGQIDALDIAAYTNEPDIYLSDWYDLLACGLRIPPSVGTDVCLTGYWRSPAGGYRVFVQADPAVGQDSGPWVSGLKAGRTFISNGPLIYDFQVDGAGLGEIVALSGERADVSVDVRIASVLPLDQVQLVCNGHPVTSLSPPVSGRGSALDTTLTVSIEESAWLAVRLNGSAPSRHVISQNDALFAHSAPIYVELDGEPVRRTAAAGRMLAWIDSLQTFIEERGNWDNPEQEGAVMARLQEARDYYGSLFRVAPPPFPLDSPSEGATILTDAPVAFSWSPANDPEEGDRLRYCVEIAADTSFTPCLAAAWVESTACLLDVDILTDSTYVWRVTAVDLGGHLAACMPTHRTFQGGASAAGFEPSAPPELEDRVGFLQTRPNPTRGAATLRWEPIAGTEMDGVWLDIFDIHGRRILTAADGFGSGTTAWGPGTCRWDGRDNAGRRVPSGTYWLRLRGSAQQGGSTAIAWERVASVRIIR